MRNTFLILIVFASSLFATNVKSQVATVNISLRNASVLSVLQTVEDQTDYLFVYNKEEVNLERKVNVEALNLSIDDVLTDIFDNTGITYKKLGTSILLLKDPNARIMMQNLSKVSGKVTDTSGFSLPGVTVVVKGTTKGTITDNDGNYSLSDVPSDATLVFSFVGMATHEIQVAGKTAINIMMEEDAIGIEEVVAVGYGTQKKVNLTGAIQTVKGDKLSKQSVTNTTTALQGLVSGLTVTRTDGGTPGSSSTLRIRGIGSIGSGSKSDPLVIVDGVPSSIDNVNPNDIENISVLKDGASTAIYGSRAAGGVILITTKRAGKGFSVTYNGKVGIQKPTILPEFVDGIQYMNLNNVANVNQGTTPVYSASYVEEYLANYKTNPDVYPNTNWNDVMYSNALLQDQFLRVSGGNDKVSLMTSIGYLSQDGIMDNHNFERYTFRLNSNIKPSDAFEFNIDLDGGRQNKTASSYTAETAARDIMYSPPIYAAKYTDGRWGTTSNGKNPKAQINDAGTTETSTDNLKLNITSIIKPLSGLTLTLNASPSVSHSYKDAFISPVNEYYFDSEEVAFVRPAGVSVSELTSNYNNAFIFLVKALASYKLRLKEKHNISALLGFEQITSKGTSLIGFRDNFVLEDFQVLNAGSTANMKSYGNVTEWALQSYFGRFNYDYMGKYLFEGNVRYDGSSRLAPGNKWNIFPSFSAGWRVSEENFMKNLDFISNLKLRASWGILGNQNIGLYPYVSSINLSQWAILGKAQVDGASLLDIANSEITWEKTETKDIGVDLGLFDSKLAIEAGFFIKDTKDILLTLPVPLTLGLNAPVQNAGKLRNKGLEFNVNYHGRLNELKYNIGLNFSDIWNEVIDLKGTGPFISGNRITKEGYALNSYYLLDAERLFQENDDISSFPTQYGTVSAGDIKYIDVDGSEGVPDGVVNPYDRQIFSNNYIRYSGGLNLGAEYKGFDFSAFFQGVFGIKRLLTANAAIPFYDFGVPQKWMLDYWSSDNPGASFPRLMINSTNNSQASTFYLKNASYLRLKNIQIGYTLPSSILRKKFIKSLRLFVSGQDILTIDNYYPGWDPENNSETGSLYPFVSSYTFGINLKF